MEARMKAMREFALADPEDCDREWAAYLALVRGKETAPDSSPTHSTSSARPQVAHNTATITSPTATAASPAVLSVKHDSPKDELSPEARRIYDYIVGNSAASPSTASPPVPSSSGIFESGVVSATPSTCSTVCLGTETSVTPTPSFPTVVTTSSPLHHRAPAAAATAPSTTRSTAPLCAPSCAPSTQVPVVVLVDSTPTTALAATEAHETRDLRALTPPACSTLGLNDISSEEDPVELTLPQWSAPTSLVPLQVIEAVTPYRCMVKGPVACTDGLMLMFNSSLGCHFTTNGRDGIHSHHTLLPWHPPAGMLNVFSILMRSSSSLIFVEVCPSSAEKMEHSVMLEKLKPGLSLEMHFLVLVVMRKEVLWPVSQSARCSPVLLLPWDPGALTYGICAKFQVVLEQKWMVSLVEQLEITMFPAKPYTIHHHFPPQSICIQNLPQLDVPAMPFMPKKIFLALLVESVAYIRGRIEIRLCCFSSQVAELFLFCYAACRSSNLQSTLDIRHTSGYWQVLKTVGFKALLVIVFVPGVQSAQLQPTVFKWSDPFCFATHFILASTLDLLLAHMEWNWCYLNCNLGSPELAIPHLVLVNYESEQVLFHMRLTTSSTVAGLVDTGLVVDVTIQNGSNASLEPDSCIFSRVFIERYSVTAVVLRSLILVVTCGEAMLWPIFQSVTGNTNLLLPWDPGQPWYGWGTKLGTFRDGIGYACTSIEQSVGKLKHPWSYLAQISSTSEFGRSGTVSIRELSFRRYPTPLVNPMVLNVYHPLSVADLLEVGLLFVVPVQDWLISCFDRQIIQYRFAVNQWEINWSLNVQYPPGCHKFAQLSCAKTLQLSLLADWSLSYSSATASCHYRSSSKISASTIQLHAYVAIWNFCSMLFGRGRLSWDPGIWAFFYFYGFFAHTAAQEAIMVEPPNHCYYSYIHVFLGHASLATTTSSTWCKFTLPTSTTSATVTDMTSIIKESHVPWDPGGLTMASAWGQAEFHGGGIVSDLSTWADRWAATLVRGPLGDQMRRRPGAYMPASDHNETWLGTKDWTAASAEA